MPRQLTNLKIEEVSSVDRGAGRGVRVVMTKRDTEVAKTYSADEIDKALAAAVASVLVDDSVTDKTAEIKELFKQFAELTSKEKAMPLSKEDIEALTKALSEKFELVEKMTPAHAAYADNLDGDESKRFAAMGHGDRDKYVKDNPINAPDLDEADSTHKPKGRQKPTGGADSAAGDTGKAKKSDDKSEGAMDESVTKALQTENETLKKRVIALEEKDQKAEFAKRAKSLGLAEVDGEMLRKVSRGDPEAFGELEKKIKALTTQVEKGGLLNEIGTSEGGGIKTANEELVAKANEIKARDKITYEAAYVKAMEEYPEIAKREKDERHARIQKTA